MRISLTRFLLFLFILFLPVCCFAAAGSSHFRVYAVIFSWLNVALEITSVICIKQYFFLGDKNQTNFQIFNLIFAVLFYCVAISFLVENKAFYKGFEQLSTSQCISKFFFRNGFYSWLQWLVLAGMFFNVLYIRKYHDA